MIEQGPRASQITRGQEDGAASRIAQARAWAEREVEQKRIEAREAGSRLLALEAQRARDLEAVRAAEEEVADMREELVLLREELVKAHETVQAMQRTRVWRFGSTYWRIRDALLRRR